MIQSVKIRSDYSIILAFFIFFIGCNSNHVKNDGKKNVEPVVNTPKDIQSKTIEQFENNSNYFVIEIDINKDEVNDKVVSSQIHKGNELYFFLKEDNGYSLVVESINFSEDGGRVIGEISPVADKNNEILKIHTYFPDGGNDQTSYIINFEKNDWILGKTIFEIGNWKSDYTKTYYCEVDQNITLNELTSEQGVQKLKHLPPESKRDDLCNVTYYFEESLDEYLKRFKSDLPDIYKGLDRYKALLDKHTISNDNVRQYNDIAYYLEQAKLYNESVFLLEKIIKKFPERTVAYINLGDTYIGLGNVTKAQEAYRKYIELMKIDNKADKIPQRVWDTIK